MDPLRLQTFRLLQLQYCRNLRSTHCTKKVSTETLWGEIIFFQLEFMTIFALTLLSWLRPAKATLVTFLPIFFGLMMDKWKEYTVANTAFTYVKVLPFCYLFLDEKARKFPLELHWRSRCIWYIYMMVLFLVSCDNVECMRLAHIFLVFLQPKTFKY